VPAETAPAEPVPAEPVPVEPVPVEPAPAEPVPAEPVPADPVQAEPVPAEPVPEPAKPTARRPRDRKPVAMAAASTTVTIRDFEFAPGSITINAGDTVTWTNQGPTPHSATAEDGSFDTGVYEDGQSRSHTFNEAGTFSYFCTPHPNMQGTVTVQAASTSEGSEPDTGAAPATDAAAEDASGPALPATGLDAGGLAVLGLMTLALGGWLRRRSAAAG
jgi:LPXTG-motif cell wall-anchored protein